MAISDDKQQISITLPKKVLEWAEEKGDLNFKKRSTYIADLVIQFYLKDIENSEKK